jgi:hypothetical protein
MSAAINHISDDTIKNSPFFLERSSFVLLEISATAGYFFSKTSYSGIFFEQSSTKPAHI